ncbi:Flagellar motor switch protein FliG [Rubripirellula tenax]|uniref:Flagellar motor switch protein FliG n=1 Tax=Rubripirellula tenax TaxID=2528015 RepID=A0A5C6ETW2_9BACT|nr:hypothetical protein [Rubripirellula tenax]TWU50899.1 Flagellar motor switch protein FliG [Rubripirellula tenax]
MAGSANNDAANRDAAMRRIAIVLTSLPSSVAAKLMGSIDQDSKQTIRRTMATLADVDPLERHRALQAFKVSVKRQPESAASINGDRFESSRSIDDTFVSALHTTSSNSVLKNRTIDPAHHQNNQSPLGFLSDVEDDHLVELLSGEHAQAVAVVLASLSPVQAARVLPRLESNLRSSALSRLGRLGDISETASAEVANHFRARLSNRQTSQSNHTTTSGRRALDAILAVMPSQSTANVAPEPAVSEVPVATTRNHAVDDIYQSGAIDSIDSPPDLRIAEHTLVDSTPPSPAPASQPSTAKNRTDESFESTDAIHLHLVSLSASDLCAALGQVNTRDALLALCGLPTAKANAVLAVLPRDQAKTVRAQMNSLSSLNLREIDRAKERVAHASVGRGGDADVSQPKPMASAAA